jgi:hypothetical protein
MSTPAVECDEVVGPSNTAFGLVVAGVFTLVAFAPAWRGGSIRLWAITLAVAFGAAAFLAPAALGPLNRVWLRVGLTMHWAVNPIVMAGLFYLAVTPFGVLRRMFRKGLVQRLRPDPAARTYWISRADEPFSSMDRQF